MIKLLNAFSIAMVSDFSGGVQFTRLTKAQARDLGPDEAGASGYEHMAEFGGQR